MKKQQGISLIVLVITIIVMIILASAVIISLNNSGIIEKAEEATEKTSRANEQQEMELLYGELIIDRYNQTQTANRDLGDYLSAGWSGENGTYVSPTGETYKEESGKMVNKGVVGNNPQADVIDINDWSDIETAMQSNNKTQVWNFKSDITAEGTILLTTNIYDLTINGNGYTITGTDDTTSNFQKYMFEAYHGRKTISINNLNIVSGYHNRSVFLFETANGLKNYLRFNNVTIDHSKGTSQNDKYGAAIVCNASEIRVQNKFTIISGPRAWAAIDLDNSQGNVSLIFSKNANISFTDNRTAEKKAAEPLIGFDRDANSENTITFTNLSSYTMQFVTKSKDGYDIL